MTIEPLPPELKALIHAEVRPAVDPALEARLLARLDASVRNAAAVSAVAGASLLAKVGGGALLFALGVGAGVLIHSRFFVAAPVPPIVITVVTPAAPVAPAVELEPRVAQPVKPVAPTPKPAVPVATLEAERRLLEPARTALGRGLHARAIELIRKHASQFPAGQLAEEREALWVETLAQAGDLDAARTRAQALEAKYPDSLFLAVVKRAVAP